MSSQSGIGLSADLKEKLRTFAADSSLRALVMHIENEQCEADSELSCSAKFSEDLAKVASAVEPHSCRYIALRSTELSFVSYVPDSAPVRSKMIYASSTPAIIKQVKTILPIATSFFWTEHSEISEIGYNEQVVHQTSAAPLTEDEKAAKTAYSLEASQMSVQSSRSGLHGGDIKVNVDSDAQLKLESVFGHDLETFMLAVFNVSHANGTEAICLQSEGLLDDVSKISSYLSGTTPSFALLSGGADSQTKFIYVIPDDSSIRDRMIYASHRISFLEHVQRTGSVHQVVSTDSFGMYLENLLTQIEASGPTEVIETLVSTPNPENDSSPPKRQTEPRFARPKRPGRR